MKQSCLPQLGLVTLYDDVVMYDHFQGWHLNCTKSSTHKACSTLAIYIVF